MWSKVVVQFLQQSTSPYGQKKVVQPSGIILNQTAREISKQDMLLALFLLVLNGVCQVSMLITVQL